MFWFFLLSTETEYGGSNSIFLRIFFDKKYALPYWVVDAVVFHFLKFRGETRFLPVLWHQAFLTFVQRYKEHISTEQKEALMELLKVQFHDKITPEIRRELQHAKCRGEEIEAPMLWKLILLDKSYVFILIEMIANIQRKETKINHIFFTKCRIGIWGVQQYFFADICRQKIRPALPSYWCCSFSFFEISRAN